MQRALHEHSGKLGPALYLGPLLGAAAGLILAVVYAYVNVYTPIAGYITILFIGGFGFGLITAIDHIARIGKSRNRNFMIGVGAFSGLFALYVSWATFEYALLSRHDPSFDASIFDLFLAPGAVWGILSKINESGWYSIAGATPSGIVLWIFWAIEAAAIVGAGVFGGMIALDNEVFCERCDRWAKASPKPVRVDLPEEVETVEAIQGGDLEPFEALAPIAGPNEPHLHATIMECRQCRKTQTYRVELVTQELDDKGKLDEKRQDLSPMYVLTPEEAERVQALADRPIPEQVAESVEPEAPMEDALQGAAAVDPAGEPAAGEAAGAGDEEAARTESA